MRLTRERSGCTRWLLLAFILACTIGSVVAAAGPESTHAVVPESASGLYWTSDDGVYHSGFDGAGAQRLVLGPPMSLFIDFDLRAGKMFWAARNNIYSANLDGGERQLVVSGLDFAVGIAVDPVREKIYWTDYLASRIERSNYDGSARELVLATGTPRGIAVDTVNQRLLFTDGAANVMSATLDGQSVTVLVGGSGHTGQDLALDRASGTIFWADGPVGTGRIWRANADGTQAQVIATLDGSPMGVDYDPTTGKIYWANGGRSAIERADADGSDWERLFFRPESITGMAVIPVDTTLTITSNATLAEDHFGSVVIAADNITLDCAGHSLIGPGEWGNGVTFPGTNGATVKNCTVTGFDGGFNIQGSNNLLVNNRVVNPPEGNGFGLGRPPGGVAVAGNTLSGNTVTGGQHGFWLIDTADNRLLNNTVTGTHTGFQINAGATGNLVWGNRSDQNLDFGFLVDNTTGNTLIANTATLNTVGFGIARSTHNMLVGNTASNNRSTGFSVNSWEGVPADDNVLIGNTANSNANGGFVLAGQEQPSVPVSRNVFRANTANGNTWYGFGAWRATGNTWQDNTANDNGHWGFALFNPCLTNTLTGNVGRRNGEFDAYDDDIPMLNTWTENKFAKTSPKGL